MKEKIICKKCGQPYDKDLGVCPYCEEVNPLYKNNLDKPKDIVLNNENLTILSNIKHLGLFLIGFLGLYIVTLVVSIILIAINDLNYLSTNDGLALATLLSYCALFVILILFLFKDNIKIIKKLKDYKGFQKGLVFGAILIAFSTTYNLFLASINIATSDNQVEVTNVVLSYPLFSLIVLGILGPICEEFTYRLGLYTVIRKKYKYLAIIVTSFFFGLLHFNFLVSSVNDLIRELLNLPSYILSGFILVYAYEKGGIVSSMTAHILNNVLGVYYILIS